MFKLANIGASALFQGDCLDIMPLLSDKSVQLILADLPYGTTSAKWDSVLPSNGRVYVPYGIAGDTLSSYTKS